MAGVTPEYNPFAAPEAPTPALGPTGPAGTDVELIRHRYLKHETSVRSIGWMCYLGLVVLGLIGGFNLLQALGVFSLRPNQAAASIDARIPLAIGGVFALGVACLNGAIGFGLRRLQVWARWTMVAFDGFTLLVSLVVMAGSLILLVTAPAPAAGNPPVLAVAAGGVAAVYGLSSLVAGYILYLLLSPKGSVVFSASYRAVIAQTPHIRYRTSIIIKILLGLLVGLIGLGVVGAIVSSFVR